MRHQPRRMDFGRIFPGKEFDRNPQIRFDKLMFNKGRSGNNGARPRGRSAFAVRVVSRRWLGFFR
jgi:hypothetical protein